jgi:DNA modification methylase
MRETLAESRPLPQTFKNGEVHDWYRLVLGFSDHLVANLIDEFGLSVGAMVLDPFSGAGTTAVECKKRGIDCWAVDANPVGCFASHVKTHWDIDRDWLLTLAFEVTDRYSKVRRQLPRLKDDRTAHYLTSSGMVERGWIGFRRLYDVIALKQSILEVANGHPAKRILLLAAMNEFVFTASNVRFGPELYCGVPRTGNVVDAFLAKVTRMADDLEKTMSCPPATITIKGGDSRNLARSWLKPTQRYFDAVITSPPYPTEHDYTRNSRLELAFLEEVYDIESLRSIKRRMMRSHTKNIYISDNDAAFVARSKSIQAVAGRIEKKAASKTDGFSKLYGKVTCEYFGGMRRHFRSLFPLVKPGGRCAYVVGDQASYFQVKIPTAEFLGQIARAEGFAVDEIRVWRERWSSGTSSFSKERILFLRRPEKTNGQGRSPRAPS